MKIKLIILLLFAVFILPGCASEANEPAQESREDVLVVCNTKSMVSTRIATYYLEKRRISPKFLVTIETPDSSASAANESISPDDYLKKIHNPIAEFLKKHNLENKIKYIVLTKGIPFRLSSDPFGGKTGGQSVDSILATMNLKNPMPLPIGEKGNLKGVPIINRYWRSKEPFSHEKYGGYLVTRLDGYTEEDAKALVDRALAPAPKERIVLLDVDPKRGLGAPSIQPKSFINPDGTPSSNRDIRYNDFNDDMINLSKILSKKPGVDVILDKTEKFVGCEKPMTVYVSWGSNDNGYKADVYKSLKFAPRSIAETAVSSSGRTLLRTSGGQSLIADLIAQGAAGAKGYVTEPYLFSMASPSVFAEMYLSGRNLAESFYAASRLIGWKDIVLGDPLCSLTE